MGTRHVTMIFKDGDYTVAQYGQWDGYPEGQGATILTFLRDKMDRDVFLTNLAKCRVITPEELKALWVEAGMDPATSDGFVSMDVADRFRKENFHLSRDMGGDILEYIQNSPNGLALRLDLAFAGDSLFCEWAYVVDFDKGTFEVYRGFNQTPLADGERFCHLSSRETSTGATYYPVRLAHSWPLAALPTDEDFINAFRVPEDEEDEETED